MEEISLGNVKDYCKKYYCFIKILVLEKCLYLNNILVCKINFI